MEKLTYIREYDSTRFWLIWIYVCTLLVSKHTAGWKWVQLVVALDLCNVFIHAISLYVIRFLIDVYCKSGITNLFEVIWSMGNRILNLTILTLIHSKIFFCNLSIHIYAHILNNNFMSITHTQPALIFNWTQ